MHSIIAYIKFIFSATNQHGVHSPFVYKYVTKCLYSKQKLAHNKTLNILLKSIDYFNFKNIKTEGGTVAIIKKNPNINLHELPYDLVYFNSTKSAFIDTDTLHNNSMILLNNIHKNSKSEAVWNTIKNHKHVTATIDLFYCGAVFIRKEQAKEHFKIRL